MSSAYRLVALIIIFCVILSRECLAGDQPTAAIDQHLLDLIDQYAPTYYRSTWNMNIEEFKAWIATIAWGEGAKGGYGAHSQGNLHVDLFTHKDYPSFTFSTGIGPFQLDRGGQDGWGTWPTIRKLDPAQAVCSIMNQHYWQFKEDSGATLQTFADACLWLSVNPSQGGNPSSLWYAVTGTTWSQYSGGNISLSWSAIETSLAGNANDLSVYPYAQNVQDIGMRTWNIGADAGLSTDSGTSIIFTGAYDTWYITARPPAGTKLFQYYYTYDASSNIEIWVYDNATDSQNALYYIFERECVHQYPEHRSNAGDTLLSAALNIGTVTPLPYGLVFNTSGVEITYADYVIPAYTCVAHQDSQLGPCVTGSLASDGVAVFDFPSGFNYDNRYDIIVVPQYSATDIRSPNYPGTFPTPLAIHVTGDFYFDGRVQIAGDDILTTTQDVTYARSGGYPGPKHNQDASIFKNRPQPAFADYWTSYLFNPADPSFIFNTRFGPANSPSGTAHYIYEPTANAKRTFGPGVPVEPPYKGGGGGGAGGVGGDSGRGYWSGVFSGGPSYGDKEVTVPFGGSAGGWGGSSSPGGAAGGGGIEIVATGNVVLDVDSQIKANGGSQLCSASAYPAGGGGGGSVKIIAGGSVTNKGIINVNGGKGGDGSNDGKNTGGGGGGGRVAIFYGTTYSNTGTITANGGAKGTYAGTGLAQSGQDGTIFVTNNSLKKASSPTPANGDEMVYCNPDPCTIQLKWYSGYGGTTDEVFCDTNPNPTTSRGSVPATRGQHSVNMTVSARNTYYMKVVTDGSVNSDTWSFTTVSWRCMQYDRTDPNHVDGPEWDFNHDCVVDFKDIEFVLKDWLNPEFGTDMPDLAYFARFAIVWSQCFNRTDGCAGW